MAALVHQANTTIPLTEVSNALRSINLPPSSKKKVKRYLEQVARQLQRVQEKGSKAAADEETDTVALDRSHVIRALGQEYEQYIGNFGRLKEGHAKPPTVEAVVESLRGQGLKASKDRIEKILNESLSLPKRHVREDVQVAVYRLLDSYIATKYGGKKHRPNVRVLFRDLCTDHPEWFNIGRGRGLSKQTIEEWITENNDKAKQKAPYVVANVIEDIREERAKDPTLTEKEKEQRVTVRDVAERLEEMDIETVPRQQLQAIVRGPGQVVDAFLTPLTFTEFDDVMTYVYYDRRMMLGRDRILDFFATLTPERLATFIKPWRDAVVRQKKATGTTAAVAVGDDGTSADDWDMNKSTVVGRVKSLKLNPHELPSVLERVRAASIAETAAPILYGRIKKTINKRRVMAWLKAQEVHQIFLPVKVKRTFAPTILKEPYSQIGIDLISLEFAQSDGTKLTASGGFVFVLTAIDMFSKRAFAVPLLNKSAESVLDALRFLFQTTESFPKGGNTVSELELYPRFTQHPRVIRSDNGTEFTNAEITSYFATHTVVFPSIFAKKAASKFERTKQLFSLPYTPQSNGAIERFNKFLKRQLNMFTTQTDNHGTWVEALPRILQAYNATKSRITGYSPDHIDRVYMSRGPPGEMDVMLANETKREEERVTTFTASTKNGQKSKPTKSTKELKELEVQHTLAATAFKARMKAAKKTRATLQEMITDGAPPDMHQRTQVIAATIKQIEKDLYDALSPQFRSLAGKNLCEAINVGDTVRLHQYLTKNMGENWSRTLYRVYSKQCKSNGKGADVVPLSRPLVRVQLIGRDGSDKYVPLPLSDPESSTIMVSTVLKNRIYLAEIGKAWFFVLVRSTNVLATQKPTSLFFWTPQARGSERGVWKREKEPVERVVTRATLAYLDPDLLDDVDQLLQTTESKFRAEDVSLFYELNGIEDRMYHEHEVLKVDAVMNPLKSEPKYIVQRLVRPVLVTKKNVVLTDGENTRHEECYPYYIVKWSGYTQLTKEPRMNLPMSMVKRFEKRADIKWVFANNRQDLATEVNSGQLSGKALTYLENNLYDEEEDTQPTLMTVGDFFVWTYESKMYIGQIMSFVYGSKTAAGDRFEEAIDANTSKRDIHAQEWKLKAIPKRGEKLARFVLNPLKKGGKDILTVVRRSDVVVKKFIPEDYDSTTDEVVLTTEFAKQNKLLHLVPV